ncbi:MAG: 4-(cytidine 5'-diphospho)-2-C-methyl-D-erythritol kinase [Gammaproteobacteria bacterium]|nr:4-(cytidine 5'-diphospho)-2-C-methyl-D-erythritol kinase [Gammaproteobacteria bacterium]
MLRILGRRDDGYHRLQTVFRLLDCGDRLRFRVRDDGRVSRVNRLAGVPESEDLVVKAAHLLQRHSDSRWGVDIYIDKQLPLGGGLGGGSSDAATTLVALNTLWQCGIEEDELARLGLSLGADVPVFVRGRSAWGEGVGEALQPLELPETCYLVIMPSCHVSTAGIFSDPDLTRNSPPIKIRDFLAGSVANDCLPVVCRRYPEVAEAIEWLGQYAEARLTGTGAAIFAEFDEMAQALQTQKAVPERYGAFVARGVNRSPLLRMVDR